MPDAHTSTAEFIRTGATTLTAVIAIVASIIAFWQFLQNRKSRRLESWNKFHERVGSAEFKRIMREEVYSLTPDQSRTMFLSQNFQYGKQRDYIANVISVMDDLSRMVLYGVLEKDALFTTYGAIIIKCWHRLRYYVTYRRGESGDNPFYVQDFVKIAQGCIEWWLDNGLGTIDRGELNENVINEDKMRMMLREFHQHSEPQHRALVFWFIFPGNALTSTTWSVLSRIAARIPQTIRVFGITKIPARSIRKPTKKP